MRRYAAFSREYRASEAAAIAATEGTYELMETRNPLAAKVSRRKRKS
jgi:hypothetical protein